MEFFTRVLSSTSRIKERTREAEQVNDVFKKNLDVLKKFLESAETTEVSSLMDMVYETSFPEEQIFMKTPTQARLRSKKELVVRLLIGLDALGAPAMAEMLAFIKKFDMDGIAETLVSLLELLTPLLEGKETPKFTSDDVVDAMDLGWHSASGTASPLLNVIASARSSPRVSAASAGDSPSHPIFAVSPFRRVLSDRSTFMSRSHEMGAKSVRDIPANSSAQATLTTSVSSQYPLSKKAFHSQELISEIPAITLPPVKETPESSNLDVLPAQGLQKKHRRKSSSLRQLLAEPIEEVMSEGSAGPSSRRNSFSSSRRRNSAELARLSMNVVEPNLSPYSNLQDASNREMPELQLDANVEDGHDGVINRSFSQVSAPDKLSVWKEDLDGFTVELFSNFDNRENPASVSIVSLKPIDDESRHRTQPANDAGTGTSPSSDTASVRECRADEKSFNDSSSGFVEGVEGKDMVGGFAEDDEGKDMVRDFDVSSHSHDDIKVGQVVSTQLPLSENMEKISPDDNASTQGEPYCQENTAALAELSQRDSKNVMQHGFHQRSRSDSTLRQSLFEADIKDEGLSGSRSERKSISKLRRRLLGRLGSVTSSMESLMGMRLRRSPSIPEEVQVVKESSPWTADMSDSTNKTSEGTEAGKLEIVSSPKAETGSFLAMSSSKEESLPMVSPKSTGNSSGTTQHASDSGLQTPELSDASMVLKSIADKSCYKSTTSLDNSTDLIPSSKSIVVAGHEGTVMAIEDLHKSSDNLLDSKTGQGDCSLPLHQNMKFYATNEIDPNTNTHEHCNENANAPALDVLPPLEQMNGLQHGIILHRSHSDSTPAKSGVFKAESRKEDQKVIGSQSDHNSSTERLRRRFVERLGSVTASMDSLMGKGRSPDRVVEVVMQESMPWMQASQGGHKSGEDSEGEHERVSSPESELGSSTSSSLSSRLMPWQTNEGAYKKGEYERVSSPESDSESSTSSSLSSSKGVIDAGLDGEDHRELHELELEAQSKKDEFIDPENETHAEPLEHSQKDEKDVRELNTDSLSTSTDEEDRGLNTDSVSESNFDGGTQHANDPSVEHHLQDEDAQQNGESSLYKVFGLQSLLAPLLVPSSSSEPSTVNSEDYVSDQVDDDKSKPDVESIEGQVDESSSSAFTTREDQSTRKVDSGSTKDDTGSITGDVDVSFSQEIDETDRLSQGTSLFAPLLVPSSSSEPSTVNSEDYVTDQVDDDKSTPDVESIEGQVDKSSSSAFTTREDQSTRKVDSGSTKDGTGSITGDVDVSFSQAIYETDHLSQVPLSAESQTTGQAAATTDPAVKLSLSKSSDDIRTVNAIPLSDIEGGTALEHHYNDPRATSHEEHDVPASVNHRNSISKASSFELFDDQHQDGKNDAQLNSQALLKGDGVSKDMNNLLTDKADLHQTPSYEESSVPATSNQQEHEHLRAALSQGQMLEGLEIREGSSYGHHVHENLGSKDCSCQEEIILPTIPLDIREDVITSNLQRSMHVGASVLINGHGTREAQHKLPMSCNNPNNPDLEEHLKYNDSQFDQLLAELDATGDDALGAASGFTSARSDAEGSKGDHDGDEVQSRSGVASGPVSGNRQVDVRSLTSDDPTLPSDIKFDVGDWRSNDDTLHSVKASDVINVSSDNGTMQPHVENSASGHDLNSKTNFVVKDGQFILAGPGDVSAKIGWEQPDVLQFSQLNANQQEDKHPRFEPDLQSSTESVHPSSDEALYSPKENVHLSSDHYFPIAYELNTDNSRDVQSHILKNKSPAVGSSLSTDHRKEVTEPTAQGRECGEVDMKADRSNQELELKYPLAVEEVLQEEANKRKPCWEASEVVDASSTHPLQVANEDDDQGLNRAEGHSSRVGHGEAIDVHPDKTNVNWAFVKQAPAEQDLQYGGQDGDELAQELLSGDIPLHGHPTYITSASNHLEPEHVLNQPATPDIRDPRVENWDRELDTSPPRKKRNYARKLAHGCLACCTKPRITP